jgi:hypothetical protein
LERRHHVAPLAYHPPPKRTTVSAMRQLLSGCGKDTSAPLVDVDGDSWFRVALADENSMMLWIGCQLGLLRVLLSRAPVTTVFWSRVPRLYLFAG